LLDNLKRFDSNTMNGSPGRMRMLVHKPIETKGLTLDDIPMLQQKVYDILSLQLKNHHIL
jgi:1-acyl-sn-glycerol-3-phosphate acyltransferase